MIINVRKDVPAMVLGTLVLLVSAFLCPVNHYAVAILLLICAVAAYLYIAIVQTNKNWFDIRAMFSAIWLATLGLAALRLTGYQVAWEMKTWFLMAAAYLMFHLGVDVGNAFGVKGCKWVKEKSSKKAFFQGVKLHGNRLFWICLGVTLFGLVCFVVNVKIKGYIPFFSSEQDTYVSFYTKIYTFSIAATMISGLSYYTLKTQKLAVWKRVFLWFSIVYATFIYPTLVVSRGAFLTAALSLTTALYYLNKKQFKVLALCAVLIVGVYGVATKARGYTEEQLNVFFEPVQVGVDSTIATSVTEIPMTEVSATEVPATEVPATEVPATEVPATEVPATEVPATEVPATEVPATEVPATEVPATEVPATEVPATEVPATEVPATETTKTEPDVTDQSGFQLSGTAAFIYSYLTVSHDNVNEAVRLNETYTYGIRQLEPFNVLLRIDSLTEALNNCHYYYVRPHLNTVNLIGNAYYDFGFVGVMVLMFIWAFIFGVIQATHLTGGGIFSLLALGNVMSPVMLGFHAPWMSYFTMWMHWGLIVIMFIVAYIPLLKQSRK